MTNPLVRIAEQLQDNPEQAPRKPRKKRALPSTVKGRDWAERDCRANSDLGKAMYRQKFDADVKEHGLSGAMELHGIT